MHRPSAGEELLGSALNFSPPAPDVTDLPVHCEERETQTDDRTYEELRAQLTELGRIAAER